MATDFERLRAWMKQEEISISKLAWHLKIPYNTAYKVATGRRSISSGFKLSIAERFGFDLAFRLFKPFDSVQDPNPRRDQVVYPEQYVAQQVVGRAIRKGEMLPAKNYKCHACDKQAAQWHHPSYHPNGHLCVVPLCRSCHGKANRKNLAITFGVVPTRVGLIRIAIAFAPEPQS